MTEEEAMNAPGNQWIPKVWIDGSGNRLIVRARVYQQAMALVEDLGLKEAKKAFPVLMMFAQARGDVIRLTHK
jgi:hypothetical protein